MEVRVTEPTKHGDSLNSYVTYKIVSKTSRNGFDQGETIVVRRYSDFVWLTEDFHRLYPGVIVPTLPDKQIMGKFSPEFVESRRRALEKFLQRISDHEDLGYSNSYKIFLQAGDSAFNEAKEATKAAKTKLTDKASSWFAASANTLKAVATSTKPQEPEKTGTDIKVDEITAYVTVLEKQLDTVVKHSENIVRKSTEGSTALFDFSQSLSGLGQAEGEDLGRALIEVGAAIEKFSFEASQHAASLLRELEEPLDEYNRYVASVKAALSRRSDKKSQLRAAVLDLELREASFNKVMGVPGKEKDAVAKQDAVEKAQSILQSIKSEYDSMSNKLITEFDLFKTNKAYDIRNIILKFAMIEAEFNQKASQFWSSVVPTIQAIDGGSKRAEL